MRKNLKLGVLLLALLIAVTAWTHNVPKSPTHDDIRVIHAMLEERGAGDLIGRVPATFEQEIDFIAAAQDAVLAIGGTSLPDTDVQILSAMFDSPRREGTGARICHNATKRQ